MTNKPEFFEGHRIRHIYDVNKEIYYFSIIDIVAILIEKDYQSARKYWKVLKGRIIKEGFDELVTNCYQLKMQADDGKMRETDVADIKTVFRIIQSVPSKKAEPVKQWLAKVGYEQIPLLWRGGCNADGVVERNTKNYMQLPYNPDLKEKAKELRKAGNLSEVLLWNVFKNKQFKGLDFDRQKIIGNYIVDFYCASQNVVIEIDGNSHDEKFAYDKKRDKYLKNLGLEVIHILDVDVKKNLDGVVKYLTNHPALTGTPPHEGNLCPALTGTSKEKENYSTLHFQNSKLEIEEAI